MNLFQYLKELYTYEIINNKALIHKNETKYENDKDRGRNRIKYENLKDSYGSYQLIDSFSNEIYKIYSPYLILESLKNNIVKRYQMDDNYYDLLAKFIQKNYDNLKDVITLLIESERDKKIKVDSLLYQNDIYSFSKRKNNLMKLVHLGYLNYDKYNNEISIPNKEIHRLFKLISKADWWNYMKEETNNIFNPGENDFKKFSQREFYVDKTELILELNKIINSEKQNICISRPRRFGKTKIVDMLSAYYRKFNVIKLNMFNYLYQTSIKEGKENIKTSIIKEVKNSIADFECDNKNSINEILNEILEKTSRHNILVIDEWDIVFRDNNKNSIEYLKFLTSLIKGEESIHLTYMTGILPLKSYGLNSEITGIFDHFSMVEGGWMSKYVGFTVEEVKELCKKFKKKKNFDDEYVNIFYYNIKEIYNGYRLTDGSKNENRNYWKTYEIYTSLSIIKAFEFNSIRNYWHLTESYDNLYKYIDMDFDGLKKDIVYLMSDKKNRIKLDMDIVNFNRNCGEYNNKYDVLVKLVHLGYLAYEYKKDYDNKSDKLIGNYLFLMKKYIHHLRYPQKIINGKNYLKK
ncbi:hypothetical protein BCR36DRAFT_374605 [Piromyces finnis]|uniref:AAA-ATPase-like domain-containing protein n=1 Tax=Piromyces finnis TaxID=1754191 RepID=A0A1Y1UMS1_9FUNG|nr:hypothetical protein BCR36DRAFT_441724 [Piromyces finnis]ORX42293.1 hypothetical protein BCR36DRAFT_374605 [Piromyces finnis]|eukprot:ORX38766.1 hypothetical protein BCR36DRAFT_441724 [Piromyces finnis]